jgi:hypothetical protein
LNRATDASASGATKGKAELEKGLLEAVGSLSGGLKKGAEALGEGDDRTDKRPTAKAADVRLQAH